MTGAATNLTNTRKSMPVDPGNSIQRNYNDLLALSRSHYYITRSWWHVNPVLNRPFGLTKVVARSTVSTSKACTIQDEYGRCMQWWFNTHVTLRRGSCSSTSKMTSLSATSSPYERALYTYEGAIPTSYHSLHSEKMFSLSSHGRG